MTMPAGNYSFEGSSEATSSLADRSPVNICPVALNLGAILQPVSQGGPENGGIGADFMARYAGVGQSAGALSKGMNWPLLLAIPGAILALFILMKLKGG